MSWKNLLVFFLTLASISSADSYQAFNSGGGWDTAVKVTNGLHGGVGLSSKSTSWITGTGIKAEGPTTGVEAYATGSGGIGVFAEGENGVNAFGTNVGVGGTGVNIGVSGSTTNGIGIQAVSANAVGLNAQGGTFGVDASSTSGHGVRGTSTSGTGIQGISSTGTGITATSIGGAGISAGGYTYGVDATSVNVALRGTTASGTGASGVATSGTGVSATATSGTGLNASSSSGTAIYANSGTGNAIEATANYSYGTAMQATGAIGVNSYTYTTDYYGSTAGFQGSSYGYTGGSTYGVNVQAGYGDYVYGIYSNTWGSGAVEDWSGFFTGNVYVGGYFDNPSDIMFKKNIRPLQGGLEKIMALKPKTYDMKVEEFKGKVSLPRGNQYGLIAQELEAVLPDLVHPVTAPAELSREERKEGVKRDPTKFKSVNYQALIPILIQAIQEQQARIEALERGQK